MKRAHVALLAMISAATSASRAHGQTAAPAANSAAPSAATPAPAPATSASTSATSPGSETSGDQPVPETGYALGVRVGFALPLGDITSALLGAMPLWIDAGRRFSKALVLGVYGYVGVAFPIIGAGYGVGAGAEGQYKLSAPIFGLDPWVGANFGYDMASISAMSTNISMSGPSGGLQAGLDYKQGFGPFAAFTVGSYSGEGGVHEWITVGMRGTYDW
jgi:hypothetical protein